MKTALLDFATLNLNHCVIDELKKSVSSLQIHNTTSQEESLSRCIDKEAVFTNKVVIDKNLIDQCPKLKYIGVLATGTNNIDLEYCQQKGITVKNALGYSTESVAQHTLGFIINLISAQSRFINDAKSMWPESETFCRLDYPINQVSGKKLGIIGYGSIGKRVTELATAFGMQVLIAESFSAGPQGRTPLSELIKTSDFISLHCPFTDKTKNLINSKFLSAMKSTAFIINTSRGPIVNEEDLAYAIENKVIAGAALDVLTIEPPMKNNPLIRLKNSNLIITPHIAWASIEARKKLIEMTIENFKEFLSNN